MAEPSNGFELLEQLRRKNGKQVQNYQSFAYYLEFRAREKGVPIHGQFELTPLCNFSCRMCYVHLDADQLKGRSVLSVGTWKDLMRQAVDAGMIRATLTGGECLAYPGFEELYLWLHSLGCEVAVLTNGFLMDEKRIEFFKAHRPYAIQVTLYGQNDDVYERVTGQRAFGTVMRHMRLAMEAELPLNISITPNRFLGADVLDTVRAAKSVGCEVLVNSGVFPPREETGRAGQQDNPETEQFLEIYRLLNRLDGIEPVEIDPDRLPPFGGPCRECRETGFLCGGGRSTFVLNWKGVMTPCNRMDIICADALKDGIASAWAEVNRTVAGWPRVPECIGCAYAETCNNCAANILRYGEAGKQPVELCERTKYLVCHGVWRIPDCE